MENCSSRAVLKEKNDNSMVEIVQQKVPTTTTTPLTKKLNDENEPLKCVDGNNVLKKRNSLIGPDELKVHNVNSPSPLPDIVNLLPTITVNESKNQIIQDTQITQNNKTEQCLKTNVPSGPSSSISSDDELFVECESYSITDKNKQFSSFVENDIKSPLSNEIDENLSAAFETPFKESGSNSNNISNWDNILSSVSSGNVENLENSKIDLVISPQNSNTCIDTTHNIFDDNVVEDNKNDNNVINDDIQLIEQTNDNHVLQNMNVLSPREIIHQKIMDNDNSTFDTTLEYSITEANNTFGLSERIANLQISNNSNSLNLTVIENKNSNSSIMNIEPNENIEALGNLNDNIDLNLSSDIEMASLTSQIDDENKNITKPLTQSNVVETKELIFNESLSIIPIERLLEMKSNDKLENEPTITEKVSELDTNDTLGNDLQISNLNKTNITTEPYQVPITSENNNDNTIDINSDLLNKTIEVLSSQEICQSKSIDNLEKEFKIYNLNVTATIEENTNLNVTQDIEQDIISDSVNIPEVNHINSVVNNTTINNINNNDLITTEKITNSNEINVAHNETFQNINLNVTQDIEQDVISDSVNIPEVNHINTGVNNTTINNINNDLVKSIGTDDAIQNLNLNLTIDIPNTNETKIKIPKKSPINLDTIYESGMKVTNSDKSQQLSTIIQRAETINELNKTHNINSGQNSPNLNFIDSNSQENLNRTFAASQEALNSTINIQTPKNYNLPIISSVDSKKKTNDDIQEIHTNNEIKNCEFKEDDEFQSNGLILNSWDFDFLLTKGNNNNFQIPRSSLLLKFDPLLGKPQIVQPEIQGLHLQQKFNQEFSPLQSVTSSLSQGRLSSAVEEEEYFGILNTNSSLVNFEKEENLIVDAANNQLRTIKTEPLRVRNKMSIDVVRDMKTENNIISDDNDNSTDVKYDIKMEDLEKKIQNEVLKRTEEIGKKIKEVEQREEALIRRITEKDKTTAKMGSVIEAYEKAIAEMISEKEEITHTYERQLTEIKSERDLNYQHLASLESTFADLHVKYERCKQITIKLKANEEDSFSARKKLLESLKLQEQRYEKMKNHAVQQLEIANNKLDFLTKNHSSEITKLKAILKKEEISKSSIAEQFQQKTRECEELLKICDELINGQGS